MGNDKVLSHNRLMQFIIDKVVDVIMAGTRPFRIIFFGGVFLALIIMNVLAMVLDINTKLGEILI